MKKLENIERFHKRESEHTNLYLRTLIVHPHAINQKQIKGK